MSVQRKATSPVRHLLPAVVAAAQLALVYGTSPNFQRAGTSEPGFFAGDFAQEWVGGRIVARGDRRRLYDLQHVRRLQRDSSLTRIAVDRGRYLPTVYPPFYYVAMAPLSLLPLRAAAWVWAGLLVAALVGAFVLFRCWVRTVYPARSPPREGRRWSWVRSLSPLWALPLALTFPPLIESLVSSQKATLGLLILTGSMALLARRRDGAAGLAFSLLAFKPQLVPLILLGTVLARRWRFLCGLAIGLAALIAVSLAVGVRPTLDFLEVVTGAVSYPATGGYPLHRAHSLYGFGVLLVGGTGPAALAVAVAGTAVVAWLVTRLCRGGLEARRPVGGLRFSGLVVGSLLVSPHLLTYDLGLLLLPIAVIVCQALRDAGPRIELLDPLPLAALLLWPVAGFSPDIAAATGVQVTTILLVVLLWLAARAAYRVPSSTPAHTADPAV